MGKGGGSNKKQIKKQYEYDTNKWEYDYDQMKLNEAYNESAFNIKVHNAEQTRNIRNQSAKNEWLDKEKMRTFNYGNQVEAYNASVVAYEKQLDYNDLAQQISLSDNNRKYNERMTQIGFQNEEALMNLDFAKQDVTHKKKGLAQQLGQKKEDAMLDKVGVALGTRSAAEKAGLDARGLTQALEGKKADAAFKGQAAKIAALKEGGKFAAMGQTGRSARKNLQAVMSERGQAQAQLLDMITKEEAGTTLAMDRVANTLDIARSKGQLDYNKISQGVLHTGQQVGLQSRGLDMQYTQTKDKTGFQQRQLQESLKSAGLQHAADNQKTKLDKYSADMAAEDKIAPTPQMTPQMTPPIEIPKPQTLAPQKAPTWDQYKKTKPIKGAVSKPSFLQKAAGVVSTAASIASIFKFSDDRMKYDITRVGTSKKGIPKYTFKYRFDGKHGPTYIGTSAQDLIAMGREDAVGQTEKDGFYYVDYSKLDIKMEVITRPK